MDLTRFERLQAAANTDPEFRIAARFWDTVLRITMGDTAYLLYIRDGQLTAVRPWDPMQQVWISWQVSITAPAEDWRKFLAPLSPPFYQDLWGAALHHSFTVEGDLENFYPYYPAMRRLFDLMRAVTHHKEVGQNHQGHMMMPAGPTPDFIRAHPQPLLPVFTARFDGPPHPAHADTCFHSGVNGRITQVRLQLLRLDVPTQHQPDVRARQGVPHGDHPQGGTLRHHRPLTAFLDRLACPRLGGQRRGHLQHRVRLRSILQRIDVLLERRLVSRPVPLLVVGRGNPLHLWAWVASES